MKIFHLLLSMNNKKIQNVTCKLQENIPQQLKIHFIRFPNRKLKVVNEQRVQHRVFTKILYIYRDNI
jgi:hypothetical protein